MPRKEICYLRKGREMLCTVRVDWTVSKDFEVEAESKDAAISEIRKKIDSGEVCVWTDGFEATDDERAYIPEDFGKEDAC